MDRLEFAELLLAATDAEAPSLIERHRQICDLSLARELRSLFDQAKSDSPQRARAVAESLKRLSSATGDKNIRALSLWTEGVAALKLDGDAEWAITSIDEAAALFLSLGQPLNAAATHVSKLHALAILGQYDEAIECALRARNICLDESDFLTAGKFEQNLGNLYFRRDQYKEAEQSYRAARQHLLEAGDSKQLVDVDTGLAVALTYQHKFHEAIEIYEHLLPKAEQAGLSYAQSVVENNLGCLALLQGQYDRALAILETSRKRSIVLGLEHEAALTEQTIADTYLELNLTPEAAAIYSRLTPVFARLGMRAEQAWILASHGQALLLLGDYGAALAMLSEAGAIYADEKNEVGLGMINLSRAQIEYASGYYRAAMEDARKAADSLIAAGAWAGTLFARWLYAESLRAQGSPLEAERILQETLKDAEREVVPQAAIRCWNSLGLISLAAQDQEKAEAAFEQAVLLIEQMRAPLPAEEIRSAFLADKLTPYEELASLCLRDRGSAPERVSQALVWIERSRSRALVEMLGRNSTLLQNAKEASDPFQKQLMERLEQLREELSWFYTQINRPIEGDLRQNAELRNRFHDSIRTRESQVRELSLQIKQHSSASDRQFEIDSIRELQQMLGSDTAVVEYFSIHGQVSAFVITENLVEIVPEICSEASVAEAGHHLRFQIDSFRSGSNRVRRHLDQLIERSQHYLQRLYRQVFHPLADRVGNRRLVIVPDRSLHYVPFQALFDGTRYLIETHEISYAPSIGVLHHCAAKKPRSYRHGLLVGVTDDRIPNVTDEIRALTDVFPQSKVLLDGDATIERLHKLAPETDVLHLACHGRFRQDNPLFSSLGLADGWLSVRDACQLNLNCELVTLSACETGLHSQSPGNELIGLSRGFFQAGTPSLLVSLWVVDDESTTRLMKEFYLHLHNGRRPAAALRCAQLSRLAENPHLFFWSPFILLGRW